MLLASARQGSSDIKGFLRPADILTDVNQEQFHRNPYGNTLAKSGEVSRSPQDLDKSGLALGFERRFCKSQQWGGLHHCHGWGTAADEGSCTAPAHCRSTPHAQVGAERPTWGFTAHTCPGVLCCRLTSRSPLQPH